MRVDAGEREVSLSELADRIEQLELRIQHLEHAAPSRRLATVPDRQSASITESELDEEKDLALFGGTLIGIGGGFLLRALTESHIVPSLVGVALGVAYAFAWLWFADRHARRGQIHAATFDAVVMAAVVFPLSWEVSIRFDVLPTAVALLVMLVSACALLVIGWKRNVASFAWVAALASIPCSAALALGDSRVSAALVCLMFIGAAIWWAARERKWTFVDLPVPMAVTIMAAVATMVGSNALGKDGAELIALALCLAFLLYAGTVTARTLLTGHDLTKSDLFAITPPALFLIAGSAFLASRSAGARPAVPLLLGIAAAGAYALALRNAAALRVARPAFATMGLICAVASSAVVLTPTAAGIFWSLLAVAFALSGVPDVMLHSALYAILAVGASGVLTKSLALIAGIGTSTRLRVVDVTMIAIVAVAALVSLIRPSTKQTVIARTSRISLLALTLFLGVAAAARALVLVVAKDGPSAATARSAAIAVAAVALVFVARLPLFRELSLLVYPLLCVGAAKFVTDDFIGGRAATLFATLAIYGVALLVVAKFRRPRPARVDAAPRVQAGSTV